VDYLQIISAGKTELSSHHIWVQSECLYTHGDQVHHYCSRV